MNIFTSEQELAFLIQLREVTEAGTLRWNQTGSQVFTFHAKTKRFAYSLASKDQDDVHPFWLVLYSQPVSSASKPIHEIESEQLTDTEALAELSGLYGLVKRTVLRLDDLSKEVFEDLDALSNGVDPVYGDEEPF